MPSLLTAVTLFSFLTLSRAQAGIFEEFNAEFEGAQTAVSTDLPSVKEPHLKDWKCEEAYPDYPQTVLRNPPVLFKNIVIRNRPNLSEAYTIENTSPASVVCRTEKKYALANTLNFRLAEEDLDFQSTTPQELEKSCRIGSIPRSIETTANASEMSQTDYTYLLKSAEKKTFRVTPNHLYMKVDLVMSNETTTSIMRCTPPQVRNLQDDDSQYEVKLDADTSVGTAVWYKLGIGPNFNMKNNYEAYKTLNDFKIPSQSQMDFAAKNQLADRVNAILAKEDRVRGRTSAPKKIFTISAPKSLPGAWTTPNPDIQKMMDRLIAYDRNSPQSVAWAKERLKQIIGAFGIIGPSTRALGDFEDKTSRPNVDRKVAPGDCQLSVGRELNRVRSTRIIECEQLTPAARAKPQYR